MSTKKSILFHARRLLTPVLIGMTAVVADAASIRIGSVGFDRLVPVYEPGQKVVWEVAVTAEGIEDGREVVLNWEATPWRGRPLEGSATGVLKDGKAALRMECQPSLLGWHGVSLTASAGASIKAPAQKRAFTVGSALKSSGKHFRYAVSTHTAARQGRDLDREMELLKRLGVDMIRDEPFAWTRVEKNEGVWTFEQADEFLKRLEDADIELEALLDYCVKWASTGDTNSKNWLDWNKAAPRLEPWLNYVRTVVSRYKGRVRYWELWNEPDIGAWLSPVEKYIELFNASAKEIKKVDPNAVVINGGFAGIPRKPNPDFLKIFVPAADKTYWGIWAYHDYHTFAQLLERNAEQLLLYRQAGMKIPVWINEGGFHCLNPGGERKQAVTLVKKYAASPALELPVTGYFWYDLRDDGPDPHEKEHHFGLTRLNCDPKPAYAAYQNLIRKLSPAQFEKRIDDLQSPSGLWALLYRLNKEETVLVAWREGGENLETPVLLGTGNEQDVKEVADIMGNPISKTPAPGGVFLRLGDEPVYVTLRGNQAPPVVRSVLNPPTVVVALPGQTTTLKFAVSNPFSQPVKAKLSMWTDLTALQWEPGSQLTFPMDSGETKEIAFQLTLPAAASLDWRQSHQVTMKLDFDGSGNPLEASAPCEVGIGIPRLASPPAPGTFPSLTASNAFQLELKGRDFIHNLYSAEINPIMQWAGDDDLSATAYLAYDAENLYLHVEVRDQEHHQRNLDSEMWAADCLQVGIRLDEAHPDSYIEFGAAMNESDKTNAWVFTSSRFCNLPVGRLDAPARHKVTRQNGSTLYQLALPWKSLGFADGPPRGAFRLNLIVNDDDGQGRKQWVQITPGLGEVKNASAYRVFVCQ